MRRRRFPTAFLIAALAAPFAMSALTRVHPYGVDVSSGVETDGTKDHGKIRAFIRRVREWEFAVSPHE